MSNTRRKLENMAEMEKRNEQRIGAFISKEAEIEHKRERLAKMQAGTAKPGMEHIREAAIAYYKHELNID